MALNSLFCADVPLSNYSLTYWSTDQACMGWLRRERPVLWTGGAVWPAN